MEEKSRAKIPKIKIKQADWILAKRTNEWFLLMLWRANGCNYVSELADDGNHRTMDKYGDAIFD